MGKRIIRGALFLIIAVFTASVYYKPVKTVYSAQLNKTEKQSTVTGTTADNKASKKLSKKEELLNLISSENNQYSKYNVEISEEDFDKDGEDEYFFVFTEKGTSKNDSLNYCADLWFGDNGSVKRIVEWNYILPDTYGCIKLAGKKYFRYDLSYATDSQTVLLGVKNGKCIESFKAPGGAHFIENSNKFTVLCSSYDMVYEKDGDYTCGHTWKNYYFYADSKGFHEYGAKDIEKKEFLRYHDAEQILNKIMKEYKKADNKVTVKFLRRCNGLLHINISCNEKDSINYYYKTFRIGKNGILTVSESAEGHYTEAAVKDIAVYQ